MTRYPQPDSPETIEDTASMWVSRRDAGLTPSDEREFAAWCANPVHADAFARYAARWDTLSRPSDLGRTEVVKEGLRKLANRRRTRRLAAGSAGVAALLLMVSVWWSRPPAMDPTAGSHTVLVLARHETLPDGSKIEAPVDSQFTVDFSGELRRVHLVRGEALFTVAKNPSRPFVVDAGGIQVRAVGTAFSVNLGKTQVAVLVTEGKVAVDQTTAAMNPAPSAHMAPAVPEFGKLAFVGAGERVVVDRAAVPASPVVAKVDPAETSERLAWRNPRVEFNRAPLGEVITLINRYNEVQFVLADPALTDIPLNGFFRADDAKAFEKMLTTGFGIEAEHRGNEVLLRKAK